MWFVAISRPRTPFMSHWLDVVVAAPAHSSIATAIAHHPKAAASRRARHRQQPAASNGAAIKKPKEPGILPLLTTNGNRVKPTP